jgi:hypothetical protein
VLDCPLAGLLSALLGRWGARLVWWGLRRCFPVCVSTSPFTSPFLRLGRWCSRRLVPDRPLVGLLSALLGRWGDRLVCWGLRRCFPVCISTSPFTSPFLRLGRLCSRRGWCPVLIRRRRVGALVTSWLGTPSLGLALHFSLGSGGRRMPSLALILLAHLGVARLITVVPLLQGLLLFRAGISIPGIIPLIARQRRGGRCGLAIPVVPSASML